MEGSYFPEGYKSPQTIMETQDAIQEVKDYFQKALAETLNLTRVTAPLFVLPESEFNDNLNGVEGMLNSKSRKVIGKLKLSILLQNGRRLHCITMDLRKAKDYMPT